MSDDVAKALAKRLPHGWTDDDGVHYEAVSRGNYEDAQRILDALAAEGIACVYVPEGVTVAHGARLRYDRDHRTFYDCRPPEATP